MIENFADELCQLEIKRTKGAKFYANIILDLVDKKYSKTYISVYLKDNMPNQTITDYKKRKIL